MQDMMYGEIRFSKFDPSSSEEQSAALGEQLQIFTSDI